MSLISSTTLDQVQSLQIKDVISGYMDVELIGEKFLCPFHSEHTPSCRIYSASNVIHCFGCGVHEDVVGVVMYKEKVRFPEAIAILCKKFNIPLIYDQDETETQEHRIQRQHNENLKNVANAVKTLASQNLLSLFSKPYTENSPQHTINQRFGNPRDTESWCCTWGLGYLPWGTLRTYAVEENLNKELLEIGLLAQSKKDGSLYSPFENRLLIPISDPWNQTVGFAARRLTEDEHAPKYINSPTSPIFKKSDVLFGLAAGRREISSSKTVYLVEGYTDVMRLYQCGVYGAVARMGTALTDAQVALLKRIGARNVVIIPDNDTAGLNAAQKDGMNLLRKGFAVSIAVLGEAGDDPDSCFNRNKSGVCRGEARHILGTKYEVQSTK